MEPFNMVNGWTSAARILATAFKSFNWRRGEKAHFIAYVCLKIIKLWLCMAKSLLHIQTALHKSVWMSRGKTYADDSKTWTTKSLNTGPSARMLSYSYTNDDAKLLSDFYNCSQTPLLQNGDKHWQMGALWLDCPAADSVKDAQFRRSNTHANSLSDSRICHLHLQHWRRVI